MKYADLLRKKDLQQIVIETPDEAGKMRRVLGVKDLTLFGIAAIIGAGIFSTVGRAAYEGGPSVSLLFVFVAFACVFTALCYAQFASMLPVSGSAYTYCYASLGEIFAWVIGWALILEYAVSNMVVAISWSSYFTGMLHGFGIDLPDWLTMGYQTGAEAFHKLQNSSPGSLDAGILQAAHTYQTAPVLFGTKILFNLPAGAIVVFLSTLAYIGIRESKMFSNFLVYLKMAIIVAVIVGGAFFVKPANWSPFAPNGMQGVLGGVAAVFFAFIGFDSISTTAEECRNPQRDMPRAMLICLAVCTLLYVAIALVLTGMRPYSELGVDDPLAYVFERVDMNFIAGVISITSVIAITSAILVFQIGQPRIWLAMSRDGLLGKRFAGIHPRFRTPAFSTVVAGILVAVPAFFLDMKMVVDLTSVGTFFAFILVCAGILYLDHRGYSRTAKFRVPYINGKYVVGLLFVLGLVALVFTVDDLPGFLAEKPLLTVMAVVWLGLSVLSYRYNCSLLPVLGILVNLYLMSELGLSNWLMFLVWLAAGLIIYFCYGYRKSRLRAGS